MLTSMGLSGCGNNTDGTDTESDTDNLINMGIEPIDDNYRTFYQIFVGSFSDSNGDGFGDLRGIINKFD